MLTEWESFYLLVGSAAAALIGLLFIVATLTAGIDRSSIERGTQFYMTPIVFHLGVILVLSSIALAPLLTPTAFGVLCGLAALAGIARSAQVFRGIRNTPADPPTDWSDKWYYGAGPMLAYVALAPISVAFIMRRQWAEAGVAAVAVVLLLLGIRNAWDLVTYLAPKQATPDAPQDDAGEA
jgi:hypothetical protein